MSKILKQFKFETPLGPMLIIADHQCVYLLEFIERRGLESALQRLIKWTGQPFEYGITNTSNLMIKEIQLYFSGELHQFTTPLFIAGTSFQQKVWAVLQTIPYGETCSYQTQAQTLQHPKAYRAVANANGANHFAIVIPCHRVIRGNGELGGYGGGIHRKQWLLNHEHMYRLNNSPLHPDKP